ncbi:MAG: hypothetical protein IPP83_07325 [Flavobacteriales bacterium]|nr:hypothetical protein [Flavobacteriales bacterium]
MMNAIIVAVALSIAGYLAFAPRLRRSARWRATVTPLASIMGSGFLVSAPLLAGAVGYFAVFCMAALLVLAYAAGGAVRFNIRHFEPIENDGHGVPQVVGSLSRLVLAGAYFISVTYYLQLLAAFVGSAVGVHDEAAMHGMTTGLLVVIAAIGMWRGLKLLEGVERFAVALNLGMIAALIVALAIHNIGLLSNGDWNLPAVPSTIDLHDVRVLLGLLIVVQGFETSRYLGDEHSAEERIVTMRRAQLISALIYLVFIGLVTVLFQDGMGSDVTAIVRMTAPLAIVLPVMISLAAIGSQFSAAVADTEGAGGLIEEISRRKLPLRWAYLLILLITVALTWATDVNTIIAYASRAFALYYTLQCVVASSVAHGSVDLPKRRWRMVGFALLALVCLLVFLFGLPSE